MDMEYSDYRIEDNIPMPVGKNRRDKYPWKMLEIGQSFLVHKTNNRNMQQLWNTLTSCRALAQRKTGRKFVMQASHLGIRVWRSE